MATVLTEEETKQRIALLKANNFNMSATARELGIARQSLQAGMRLAVQKGWLSEDDLSPRCESAIMEVRDARDRKRLAYEEKARKGDWRKPILKTLPDEPFRLKLFGDPHLENDACNFDLFEEHMMDLGPGVYGACIGDFFDNWRTALAGIYAENATRPSEAWTLLCHLMDQRGEFMLAACSGNHDDWSHGPVDPVSDLMRRHGVSYRKGAIRLALRFPGLDRTLTAAFRHKWHGNSMYSPGHGGKKAAMFGWRDHLSAGGHTHVGDYRIHSHPEDDFKQHHFQIPAFKEFDDYADVHGFMPHRLPPFVDVVIDPRRPDDDLDMIKAFWDNRAAAAYLRAIRAAN